MKPTPILFLGDAPDQKSGLARIGRDLATQLSRHPRFRVGYLGLGGAGSRQLPFAQYQIQMGDDGLGRWGELSLPRVWQDFAGRETGVVFSIWDFARVFWLGVGGANLPEYGDLQEFLSAGHFARWGYFPIDATGPRDRLSIVGRQALLGYDRVLAYTPWAFEVVKRTLEAEASSRRGLAWLPHGLNLSTFQPRDRAEGRKMLGSNVHDGDFLVGVVATNQARKDWGLMAAVAAELKQRIKALRLWWHVDVLERYWSIPTLIADYGLDGIITVTNHMTDEDLSFAYSACDVTLHPGLGEGFGYPIVESLACGTPAVHGDYGGGTLYLDEGRLVKPSTWRVSGLYNNLRPVYDPGDWVEKVMAVRENPPTEAQEFNRSQVEHLDWPKLWPSVWQPWFERGLEEST